MKYFFLILIIGLVVAGCATQNNTETANNGETSDGSGQETATTPIDGVSNIQETDDLTNPQLDQADDVLDDW